MFFFFSSRRRHTRCALVTGVQTCALPIFAIAVRLLVLDECSAARVEQFLRCGLALGDLGGEEREFLAIQTQAAFRRLQFPVRPLVGIDSLMGCEAHNTISDAARPRRSEEHTSELQSLMRISYAVFCLKKQKRTKKTR